MPVPVRRPGLSVREFSPVTTWRDPAEAEWDAPELAGLGALTTLDGELELEPVTRVPLGFALPSREPARVELDVGGLEAAARALLVAAGRPEGWAIATEYEREAWRTAASATILAYLGATGAAIDTE